MNHESMNGESGDSAAAARNLPENQHDIIQDQENRITDNQAVALSQKIQELLRDPEMDIVEPDSELEIGGQTTRTSHYFKDNLDIYVSATTALDSNKGPGFTNYQVETYQPHELPEGKSMVVKNTYLVYFWAKINQISTSFSVDTKEYDSIGNLIKTPMEEQLLKLVRNKDHEGLANAIANVRQNDSIDTIKFAEVMKLLGSLAVDDLVE